MEQSRLEVIYPISSAWHTTEAPSFLYLMLNPILSSVWPNWLEQLRAVNMFYDVLRQTLHSLRCINHRPMDRLGLHL